MDVFLLKAAPATLSGGRMPKPQPAAHIIARFGNDLVVSGAADGRARRAADADALAGAEKLAEVDPANLRVVVQKGRLFALEHPEVPILVDRGRYLLVDIAPDRAASLAGDTCYTILPAGAPIVAFEQPPRRGPCDPVPDWEKALVADVEPSAFRADLDALCAAPNRHSLSESFKAMTVMARARFEGLRLQTRVEAIDIKDGNGAVVGASCNVLALKPGMGASPRGLVLVTAHLDTVNKDGHFDPTLPAQGADDNGSGSAGVLQMARILGAHAALDDTLFILFGGEEQGLHGSSQFVARLPSSDRARLRAIVNMDMIGVLNHATQSVLLEGAPVSRHVIDGLAERAAAHTALEVRTSLNPYNSDHVPFIRAGLAAVLVIEGDDGGNTAIHTPADTGDKVSDALAAEILRMNVGYVASLVGRAPPS